LDILGLSKVAKVIPTLTLSWCLSAGAATYLPSIVVPPKPPREFRAVWVATVANIDWPSAKNLSVTEQKSELIRILDRAAELKLNVVILQVRPACDALYASPIEPWSEYLTGTMGQPPNPYYDPLSFAVEEAHKRGLELHAWFNPYRARLLPANSPAAPNHISRTHPHLVRQYGKFLWLDPGEKDVQDYSLGVVMDVVKRYDIDGVHFDDYFYPYKEKGPSGNDLDFPDASTWERFGAHGKMSRDDWRRQNVNTFIERVYQSIKAAKPWVKFGVSPFGIWRPGQPKQITGYDAYANLYADSRKWLVIGWLDYFAPQLYWAIDPPEQSFPVLLKWWAEQNPRSRLLTPGMDSTKVGGKWRPTEIVNQIRLTRRQPGANGQILWNMKSLMRNSALDEALTHQVYAQRALVPAATWLSSARPARPKFLRSSSELTATRRQGGSALALQWTADNDQSTWLWLLQSRKNGDWATEILPGAQTSRVWKSAPPEVVSLCAVDRNGIASAPVVLESRQ